MEKVNGEDLVTGIFTQYRVKKNKLGAPERVAQTFLNINENVKETFMYANDIVAYGVKFDLIKKGGAWFTVLDVDGSELYKCQGGARLTNFLKNNTAVYTRLKLAIYSKIYQPYEFYYHFDLLKTMMKKENELLKVSLKEDIKFSEEIDWSIIPEDKMTEFADCDESEAIEKAKEYLMSLVETPCDIENTTIDSYLSDIKIEEAKHTLLRVYDDKKIEELEKINGK